MKSRPVRICDISRVIRISSASLITFLQERGFRVKGDFRSPLSCRMLESIQTGYQEGPPFSELNSYFSKAELWENEHAELVSELHTPEKTVTPQNLGKKAAVKRKPRRTSKSKVTIRHIAQPIIQTGKINLSFLDLELIHRLVELTVPEKLEVKNFLRRKLILKTIANLE